MVFSLIYNYNIICLLGGLLVGLLVKFFGDHNAIFSELMQEFGKHYPGYGIYSQENGYAIQLGATTMAFCGKASLDQQYLTLLGSVAAGGEQRMLF